MTDATELLATIVVAREAELNADLELKGLRPGHDNGSPMVRSAQFYSAGGTRVGVWECTPGGWHIQNRPDTETMLLLKGHVRMTTDGADPVELRAGDVFVLPKAWSGRWDVLETTRKFYIVAEDA
jgi:uncharacterized cupin superfamily protein